MSWWMIVPGNPALSVVAIFLVALPFLYFGRTPMHGLVRSATLALANPLRLGSRWLMSAAAELRRRNETVLMAHGRAEAQKTIEREFERVSKLVQRDLNGYPALQRKVMDEITRIEEDYQKCGEVPPPPPEWAKVIETIAKIKPSGDGLVEKLLEDIATSINKIYDKALGEYRHSYEQRHKILKGFMPFWRSLDGTMKEVDRNLAGLQEAGSKIDAQMEKYENIMARNAKAEHELTSSAMVQVVISGVFLLLLFGGAFVNFKLVALPMSEMVGGGEYITNSLQASDVAALVIILLEAGVGLFLMESLRMTHLLPGIHNLNDRSRHRLIYACVAFLFIFAGIEVVLAYMRDHIAAANLALKQALGGVTSESAVATTKTAASNLAVQIPMFGQMVLSFVLPFVLSLIGIPLEYFLYSARTVLGVFMVISVRGLAFGLRGISSLIRYSGKAVLMFYDVVIFLPLAIERGVKGRQGMASSGGSVTAFQKRRTATGEHVA